MRKFVALDPASEEIGVLTGGVGLKKDLAREQSQAEEAALPTLVAVRLISAEVVPPIQVVSTSAVAAEEAASISEAAETQAVAASTLVEAVEASA